MGKARRSFTPKDPREAARLVIDTGRPIAHVPRRAWPRGAAAGPVGEGRAGPSGPDVVAGVDERAELERLRKENASLRISRTAALLGVSRAGCYAWAGRG